MTKIYKLLIDSPEIPNGSYVEWNDYQKAYELYYKNAKNIYHGSDSILLSAEQVENRPHIWELIEEKLDLRSPAAERMREEARSKRWEYIPEENDLYYVYDLEFINNVFINKNPWEKDAVDFYYWNTGNCHRTEEEALAWGKKYARYFLTE